MRNIYLLLLSFFVFANLPNTNAQVVTIPNSNTNSSSVNDPLGTFFGYERTALIYTPAEVGTAGTISSVGFYINSLTAAASATDVRIYIKHRNDLFTAASTYANEIAGATLVYGPTTITAASLTANQWKTITLATNFVYNGTSNLEIIVETNFGNAGGEGSTGKQFRATDLNSLQYYQRWNQDNAAPTGNGVLNAIRPNVQITFSSLACVPGSLAGGTTQSSVAAACAGLPFDLYTAPGSASFGSSMVYQWQSSPDGITWTSIAGATTVGATVSQTSATYYRRKMTCTGTDAFSTPLQVTQNTFLNCYCNTGLTASVNGVDIVTNVSLTNETGGNYTNASTSNGTSNYVAYNNTALDLGQQTSGTLAITFGTDGTQWSAAWIDWNQNGVFESSENIALAAISTSGGTTVTYNFDVPATAVLGNTRMRVRGGSDAAYAISGACAPTDFGETEDYIINIVGPPACIKPSNVGLTALGSTSATISWTAPTPGPASGYEWEVRTSGAPGSGATGLAANGTTGAGVTTANVPGLLSNSSYNLYVRSVCTPGTVFSLWSRPVAFATPCTFVTSFPFIETFETTSPTVDCWNNLHVNGTTDWSYEAGAGNGGEVTTAHSGSRNAAFYGDGTGDITKLVSPPFNFSGIGAGGAVLRFWYSNQLWDFDQNELRVYYKTSTFGTWTLIPGAVYDNTKNIGDWTEVELALPGSTTGEYYIAFEGTELFGYGITVDDVWVGPVPTCNRPTAVMATGATSSTIEVSFTSTGNDFIVEYGAPGFTPGTGAAAGAGGTIVTGTASPLAITGLPANTDYDVYVRRVCSVSDYSDNVLSKTRTQCAATNVPYIQDFTGVTSPNIPGCTSLQDFNGWPGWQVVTPPATYGFPGQALRYSYVTDKGGNDWFYTQGINLTAGTIYELDYKYGTTDPLYPERMKVAYGGKATATAMTTVLKDYPAILANGGAPFAKLERLSFTPATSGVYYFGFQVYSAPDQFRLYLDSIHLKVAPIIDAAITAIAAIPNCTGNTQLQATVYNNNLSTLDFAAHPVTVTANITGTSTGSVNFVVNTGTLAPGASRVITLPGYNFAVGNFTATVTASSPDDGIAGNNTKAASFTVNALPTQAIITPAAPVICAGATITLATQFTTTGNPKVTWTPLTGLFVNAAATMAYTAGVDSFRVWAKPAATTTYTVTTTNATTGCTNTSTVTVTVNNSTPVTIQTVPPTRICVSDPGFDLVASPAGGTWSGVGILGTTFFPGRTIPGSYPLAYTLNNATNCVSSSSIVAKVEECAERRRLLRDDAIVLFPNPSSGQFNLKMNSTLYSDLVIKVYTTSGNLVRTEALSGLSFGRVVPFNFSHLPGGTYMVHVIYDGGVKFSEKVFPIIIGH